MPLTRKAPEDSERTPQSFVNYMLPSNGTRGEDRARRVCYANVGI